MCVRIKVAKSVVTKIYCFSLDITYGPPTKVRLAGTDREDTGRVEIFYRGEWGAVCDDSWTLLNGHVVCRQLGYQRAKRVSCCGAYGGSTSKKLWLDEVSCKGTEASILNCTHAPFGDHNCDSQETAGVECVGPKRGEVTLAPMTTPTPTVIPTTPGFSKYVMKIMMMMTVVEKMIMT